MYDVGVADYHALLLLTERTEDIFHQAPTEEGSILIDPLHFEVSEVAYLGEWGLGSGDDTLLLVEVNEYVEFIADADSFGDIAGREKDFPLVTSI